MFHEPILFDVFAILYFILRKNLEKHTSSADCGNQGFVWMRVFSTPSNFHVKPILFVLFCLSCFSRAYSASSSRAGSACCPPTACVTLWPKLLKMSSASSSAWWMTLPSASYVDLELLTFKVTVSRFNFSSAATSSVVARRESLNTQKSGSTFWILSVKFSRAWIYFVSLHMYVFRNAMTINILDLDFSNEKHSKLCKCALLAYSQELSNT